MKKFLFCFIMIFSIIFTSNSASYASAPPITSSQADCAKLLSRLGVIETSKTGSKIIKSKVKKHELISILVPMFGYEEEDASDTTLPYKDVDKSHKSYNNIKIAYKYGLITGEENSSLSPNSYIIYADALKMILNALGYSHLIIDLSPEEIVKLAAEKGICGDIKLSANKQLTYGDAYVLLYNSLVVDYYSENQEN